jgi:DNA polymerase-4
MAGGHERAFGREVVERSRAADILHADLDAFYASVEQEADPSLRGRPLIVGWPGPRGVVLSCSYEARAAGVRNGMPSMRAKRLCPAAVFVPARFDAYQEKSRGFREVLRSFTPLVETTWMDEAFCDVSGAHTLYGSTLELATAIRRRVAGELKLICSVGAGSTKFVAKMASRACKPNGVLVVGDSPAFLSPIDVGDLWGVGDATAARLHELGIRTVSDLLATPATLLRRELGQSLGSHLAALARGGHDEELATGDYDAKSVGAEETFETDLASEDRIQAEILRLADRVASRMSAGGVAGRCVTVKIRLASFATHTRSRTVREPTGDLWTIYRLAREAYESFGRGRQRVRLLGVSMSGLVHGPLAQQLSLDRTPPHAEAAKALASVRRRFGQDALTPARLLRPD